MKFVRGLLGLLILAPTVVYAADQQISVYRDKPRSYIAANLVNASLDFSNGGDTLNTGAISVRMGGMAGDHFGMETRLGPGVGKTTERVSSGNTRVKTDYSLDHIGGVYFTARRALLDFPSVGKLFVQGYLGVGTEQIKTVRRVCNPDCSADTERNDETGPSYGATMGFRVGPELSVVAEYMRYVSKDAIEVSGLEAGIQYHF